MSDSDSVDDWEVVEQVTCVEQMSALVPTSSSLSGVLPGALAEAVAEVRRQLGVVKSALDSRDSWEAKAAAHEASQFASPGKASVSSGRSGRGGSRGNGGPRMNRGDLKINPPSTKPPKIPKSLRNQLFWISGSYEPGVITLSTSTVVENNYAALLSNFTGYSNLVALFDQYFIAEFSVSFFSQYPQGGQGTPCKFYSAIDFDNTANLGTISAIESYGSCQIKEMIGGTVVTRSCRPCVKDTVSNVSNSGCVRQWIDTSYSSINHYGIRSIAGVVGATYTILPTISFLICFRNVV